MKFFRKGLEENITLPAPPTDDVAEAKEVKRIVAIRTAKDVFRLEKSSIRNS